MLEHSALPGIRHRKPTLVIAQKVYSNAGLFDEVMAKLNETG